jgi:hypothetical protein
MFPPMYQSEKGAPGSTGKRKKSSIVVISLTSEGNSDAANQIVILNFLLYSVGGISLYLKILSIFVKIYTTTLRSSLISFIV